MPRLPHPRPGRQVEIRDRPLAFSFWPMYKGERRFGLQTNVFATNAWAIIRGSVKARAPSAAAPEALAVVLQAEQFFRAATDAELWAAKPLLLYYAFMNLAKALVLTSGRVGSFDQATHGMSERLRAGNRELADAYLEAYPSPRKDGRRNLFADFAASLEGYGLPKATQYDVPFLLPQVVTGHRLWCDAAQKRERFVAIEQIEIMQDEGAKRLWLRLNIFADDLTRLGVNHAQLRREARMRAAWREVTPEEDIISDRRILRFEQLQTVSYSGRPSDKIPALIEGVRRSIWATVTSVPPYRKYYLYLAPLAEHTQVRSQLVALYALIYYLGSVTRYRPQHFDDIIEGRFGEQIQEILTNQPNQFLYLIASEFAQRDVTRAAIV